VRTTTQNFVYYKKILLVIDIIEGKFLVTKFEFEGSFGMSLEGDFYGVEVIPNLELLVTFEMNLEG
jgi:hypothetical protein